jgi:hypothetical protein
MTPPPPQVEVVEVHLGRGASEEQPPQQNQERLSLTQLRRELRRRGAATRGHRVELERRLQEVRVPAGRCQVMT